MPSAFEWATTQSLYIIGTISSTSNLSTESERCLGLSGDTNNDSFKISITSNPIFGFTIGATRRLLQTVSHIGSLFVLRQSKYRITDADVDFCKRSLEACDDLFSNGTAWENGDLYRDSARSPYRTSVVQHQLKAFLAAAYIFMHRSLLDATPHEVRPYVVQVFEAVDEFFNLRGGNFSLWPAFIAATEACEGEDIAAANRWLERAMRVGMGNRLRAKVVIEEVWRRRQDVSKASDIPLNGCRIDWRDVMMDLDIDILLI